MSNNKESKFNKVKLILGILGCLIGGGGVYIHHITPHYDLKEFVVFIYYLFLILGVGIIWDVLVGDD